MNSPATLVSDLRHRGVRFWVRNQRLVIDAPDDALTDQDIQSLRTNKSAIVALLGREHPPTHWKLHCHSCRSRRFWRSIYGQVICAVCHPPAADHLVADWPQTDSDTNDD